MFGGIRVYYYRNSLNECDDVEIYDQVSYTPIYIKGENYKFGNLLVCRVTLNKTSIP